MAEKDAMRTGRPIVVALSSEHMGHGDDQLGQVLMRSFLNTLGEAEPGPDTLILFNSAVRLAVHGSSVLDELHALQTRGVQLLLCGTCLGHFDLKEKVAVGEISNMHTICETMLGAARLVNL